MPNQPQGGSGPPFTYKVRRFTDLSDGELLSLTPLGLESWLDTECWHRGIFRAEATASRKARNRIQNARNGVFKELQQIIAKAAEREKRRVVLRERFRTFVDLANGSTEIARRFFRMLYDDAEIILPELFRPDPADAASTRAIDFEDDP